MVAALSHPVFLTIIALALVCVVLIWLIDRNR